MTEFVDKCVQQITSRKLGNKICVMDKIGLLCAKPITAQVRTRQ